MNAAEKVEFAALSRQEPMNAVIDRGDSAVQQFYRGATVFVTGGSGFFGKQLIEKLFRACQLKKMYVLLRPKRGKFIQERLEFMLKDPVFDLVREKQPTFADKIVPVEGDVADIRLGLSDKDWSTITSDVDTIFHVAATVKFDEPLRMATLTNVRGTREAVALAKQCTKLKQFVYVSTAFCHATSDRIGKEVLEQFYPAPVPPDVMITLAEEVDETRLNNITPELIKGWPNTYTFTKAIAEEVMRTRARDLPICVVRPPIVTCCYYEPSPGWMDMSCVYGAGGFILGAGLGVVRVAHVDKCVKLNMAPLDIVNNAIIAAGWDAAERRAGGDTDVPVYTVTNDQMRITFESIANVVREVGRTYPTPKAMWYCYMYEIKNKMLYNVISGFLHYLPAYIIDTVCAVFRLKLKGVPPFVKTYQKYDKLVAVNNYFLSREFAFKDDNVKGLIRKMSDVDKAIFNCDLSTIDLQEEFVKLWCLGIRKFIIKDGLQNVEEACRKQKIFRIANYVVLALYFYVLWSILSMCWYVVKYMWDI